MFIEDVKRLAVGEKVKDLEVVVTTAGQVKQVDGKWEQKLGLTDTSGHIWGIITMPKNIPCKRTSTLIIKEAAIDEFTTKGGDQQKRLLITKYDIPANVGEPPLTKQKFEGILDPLVERILARYDISPTDALWPCTRTSKKTGITTTNWIIYHRYCEQIAAKAGIVFDDPIVAVNETDDKGKRLVVLLVKGQLGHVKEWSYGEASPATTVLSYIFAMAEKRAKDRVILKLAGFHGMVYSDVEEDWKNDK